MGGELTRDRVASAVDFAEAMFASQLPLAIEQGGEALGLDDQMAEHARTLAGRIGFLTDVEESWLRYIVDWYEQEESACLAVGINYRAEREARRATFA